MNEKRIDHIAETGKMVEKSAIEKCIDLAALSPHKAIAGEIVPNARQELADMRAELDLADALTMMQHERTLVADKLWQRRRGTQTRSQTWGC